MHAVLLQAMMAAPFVLGSTLLMVIVVVYTILRLGDRVSGKRASMAEEQRKKRRSVHILIAIAAGILVCGYIIYVLSRPEAGLYN